MLAALLGQSAMWAATDWEADGIEWVVADRGGLEVQNLPIQPWTRTIGEASRVESPVRELGLSAPAVFGASDRAGLQVADLIVHALGPGPLQDRRVPESARAKRTRARVMAELQSIFKVPVWVAEHDALAISHHVHDLLSARTATARDEAWRALRDRAPSRPPDGVYPAAVEWAQQDVARALGVK